MLKIFTEDDYLDWVRENKQISSTFYNLNDWHDIFMPCESFHEKKKEILEWIDKQTNIDVFCIEKTIKEEIQTPAGLNITAGLDILYEIISKLDEHKNHLKHALSQFNLYYRKYDSRKIDEINEKINIISELINGIKHNYTCIKCLLHDGTAIFIVRSQMSYAVQLLNDFTISSINKDISKLKKDLDDVLNGFIASIDAFDTIEVRNKPIGWVFYFVSDDTATEFKLKFC